MKLRYYQKQFLKLFNYYDIIFVNWPNGTDIEFVIKEYIKNKTSCYIGTGGHYYVNYSNNSDFLNFKQNLYLNKKYDVVILDLKSIPFFEEYNIEKLLNIIIYKTKKIIVKFNSFNINEMEKLQNFNYTVAKMIDKQQDRNRKIKRILNELD